jgi:hypothetical protein
MNINTSSNRRTFLKGAVLLGGTALALAAGGRKKTNPETINPQPAAPDRGYRLTAHIRKYYETAGQ